MYPILIHGDDYLGYSTTNSSLDYVSMTILAKTQPSQNVVLESSMAHDSGPVLVVD